MGYAHEHGGEQSAQHREHRGGFPPRDDGDTGARERHREHAREGRAAGEQAVERVSGEEREIENAETAAGEPFGEEGQVAAGVEEETGREEPDAGEAAEHHPARGPDQVIVEGPLQEEADAEEDGDDAHPGGPAGPDALLEVAGRRPRRRARHRRRGEGGRRRRGKDGSRWRGRGSGEGGSGRRGGEAATASATVSA